MTSKFIHEEISIMDFNGLSLTVKDPRLSQKARLSRTIMDYHKLSQTIKELDNYVKRSFLARDIVIITGLNMKYNYLKRKLL